MNSPLVTALLFRLGAGLIAIALAWLALRIFDPSASRELLNVVVSVLAIIALLAPNKWFQKPARR
jgi:hypothetical protein